MGGDQVKEARLQTLKTKFDAMRMKEDKALDLHTGRLTAMSVKYSNLGGSLDDAVLVKKLSNTMPERFINVVARIE